MAVHHQHQEQEESHIPKRLNILFFIVFIFFAVLILRLAIVQLVHGEEYRAISENTKSKTIPVNAPRGFIKDRNGVPLVTNKSRFTLTYLKDSKSNIDQETIVKKLAPVLSMTEEDILKEMNAPGFGFVPKRIKIELTKEEVAWVSEHQRELPGVEVIVEMVRQYLYNEVAAHALGYTRPIRPNEIEQYKALGYLGDELVGWSGIEMEYENELHGRAGEIEVEVNSVNSVVNTISTKSPVRGNDLLLTIDIEFQKKLEQYVRNTITEIQTRKVNPNPNVKEAAVVVMKPKTGEVLAMVSYPGYDMNIWNGPVPNDVYNEEVAGKESNQAISRNFAPGSTVKPITLMMGLQEGVITPTTIIYDPGYLEVGYRTNADGTRVPDKKYNWRRSGEGSVDIREALKFSNNTYMYQVALWLGRYPESTTYYKKAFATFAYYNQMFGLGGETGIDLPNESDKLSGYSTQVGDLASAAIGQYEEFTPIQLANCVSTIANYGVRVRPHVLKEVQKGGIRAEDKGTTISVRETEVLSRVDIDPKWIKIVQEGMAQVTDPRGTGYSIFGDLPIKVAAKTGTAQTGGAAADNSLIVGYAPYDDPEIAFVVVIPKGGGGSAGSGLLARDIVMEYFGLKKEETPVDETTPTLATVIP